MKRSFLLVLLVAGCVGTNGGDRKGPGGGGGGDGGPDDTSGGGDTDDTADPPDPVVLEVCSDGDYTSVQAAVDAAPEGAIVQLCGEGFSEHVVVSGRTLTLRGEPGATLTGGGDDRPLVVTGTELAPTAVTVEGITITDGWSERGGGIWCEGATLDLTDVVVTGNGAEKGAGIASSNCVITMTRTDLVANAAWGEGGGGLVEGGSLTITESLIADNSGADGGGILVRGAVGELADSIVEGNQGHVGGGIWFDGSFSLTRNQIRRNFALFTGGGFGGIEGTGWIRDNDVYENRSETDGGGGFTQSFTGTVADNHFTDNLSNDDAAGLRMLYGAAVVERNTFTANIASNGSGGAMKVSHAGCEIRDNTFEYNVADEGGGIEVDDDVSHLARNTFRGNQANGRGGAIHFNEPYWDMEIEDIVMEDNVAGSCGGAMAMDDDGLTEVPEDVYTVYASRIRASGNTAGEGGALCVLYANFALSNGIFSGNTAEDGGGAVYVEGAGVTLTNVVLAGNTGTDTITLLSTPTARASATITDSIVSGNTGGVLHAQGVFPVWRYNLHNGNDGNAFSGMADPTGDNGNLDENPAFVDAAAGNYYLSVGSPAVNAGDPTRTDADGSRVDMGAYGGAYPSW